MWLKSIFILAVMFIIIAAVSIFAQTSTDPITAATSGLPKWVSDVLAILGIAGVGGVGVFAGVAKKVAAAEAKYLPIVQGLKNVIDKNANLFAELKSIVASSDAIPSWNAAMQADATFFKTIPLAGIEAKADIFNRLIINQAAVTAAITKAADAVNKVETIADKIPTGS